MIKTPIVVAEGWDVKLYATVRDAELDLEPVDVETGVYRAYDAEGRALRPAVEGSAVVLAAAEPEPGHRDELRELLAGFLSRVGDQPPAGAELERLVTLAGRHLFRPPRSGWDVVGGLFRGG